jgi:hypothetical protein
MYVCIYIYIDTHVATKQINTDTHTQTYHVADVFSHCGLVAAAVARLTSLDAVSVVEVVEAQTVAIDLVAELYSQAADNGFNRSHPYLPAMKARLLRKRCGW